LYAYTESKQVKVEKPTASKKTSYKAAKRRNFDIANKGGKDGMSEKITNESPHQLKIDKGKTS